MAGFASLGHISKVKNKSDYFLQMVDDIPAQETSEGFSDPIGLVDGTGGVGAIERGGSSSKIVNVAFHELGHVLALDHDESKTNFMYKSNDGKNAYGGADVSTAQKKELWDFLKNQDKAGRTFRFKDTGSIEKLLKFLRETDSK